jgi:hypothetical protein
MDVEGLSYEALRELTERVGASETDWGPDRQRTEAWSKFACDESVGLLDQPQQRYERRR